MYGIRSITHCLPSISSTVVYSLSRKRLGVDALRIQSCASLYCFRRAFLLHQYCLRRYALSTKLSPRLRSPACVADLWPPADASPRNSTSCRKPSSCHTSLPPSSPPSLPQVYRNRVLHLLYTKYVATLPLVHSSCTSKCARTVPFVCPSGGHGVCTGRFAKRHGEGAGNGGRIRVPWGG